MVLERGIRILYLTVICGVCLFEERERIERRGGFETEERKISEIERVRGRVRERVASEDYGFVIE